MCDCCCDHDHHHHHHEEEEDSYIIPEGKLNEEINLTADGGVTKKITKLGEGEEHPPKGSEVSVHYVGTLTTGEKFDSSRDRNVPFTFKLGQGNVIRGWDIGVATMKKGEVALLTCKPEYAYGERAQGSIPANSTLIFEVELLSWEDKKDVSSAKDKSVMKKDLVAGEGWETPSDEAKVTVDYDIFEDFACSKKVLSKENFTFVVGDEEIDSVGFEDAVKSLKVHEKARFFITKAASGKAFEENAVVNDTLAIEITLKEMNKPKATYQLEADELMKLAEAKRVEGNDFYKAKRMSMATKRYKKALECLSSDYKFNDEQKKEAKKMKVLCHNNIAAVALFKKDYAAVIDACNKALEIEPLNDKALVRKAKALDAKEEWEDAISLLNKVLESAPENAEAKKQLALSKKKLAAFNKKQSKAFAGFFEKYAKEEAKEEEEKKSKMEVEEEAKKDEEKKQDA